ncbi:MAG: SPOR domain-containing protein [Deltaproteobacteria bacterium]|nr:SPOR domain-containing protein [Deltaproteobacteria bacterium]MBW2121885.1 SPOR domain-containing protein [Deltaproteobacteria bacterium]
MVRDLKRYGQQKEERGGPAGWSILAVSHMAIFVIGTLLGYWIGQHFTAATTSRGEPSLSAKAEERVVPEAVVREGERGEEGGTGVEGPKSEARPDKEEARFTFYESLPRAALPGTEGTRDFKEEGKTPPPRERSSVPREAASESRPAGPARKPTPLVYYVQVASFREEARAERLRKHLRAKGFAAEVVSAVVLDKGIWYRVRLGPFGNREEARKRVKAIAASEGLKPIVLSERAKMKR